MAGRYIMSPVNGFFQGYCGGDREFGRDNKKPAGRWNGNN